MIKLIKAVQVYCAGKFGVSFCFRTHQIELREHVFGRFRYRQKRLLGNVRTMVAGFLDYHNFG